MSHVDFKKVVTDMYGEDMTVAVEEGKPPKKMTLGWISTTALGKAAAGETLEEAEKFDCFLLGCKIAESEKSGMPLDLEAADVVRLKQRIGKMFVDPGIVGRAFEMIEPGVKPKPAGKGSRK